MAPSEATVAGKVAVATWVRTRAAVVAKAAEVTRAAGAVRARVEVVRATEAAWPAAMGAREAAQVTRAARYCM